MAAMVCLGTSCGLLGTAPRTNKLTDALPDGLISDPPITVPVKHY